MRPFPLMLLGAFLLAPTVHAAPVEYRRDVQPLLVKKCITCHGPTKQRGGLRLDSVAAVRAGGNSGPAIIVGKSGESRLIHAVTGTRDAKPMPPKGPRLTAEQVTLLKAWIDTGASEPSGGRKPPESSLKDSGGLRPPLVPKYWSFQPIRHPDPPAVRDRNWGRNPIDAFILARLEKQGIRPSPEADRITLIRRLSLDLLGLPPTPAEVDAFVNDPRPDAYEQLVDRLLASPHYGERMARHWLDLARYADSHGYSIDGPRSIWPYRDWVIRALNADMPFDRFTIEQLAGDLLPRRTRDQLVATGFHRNTPINMEGGINVEQFRVESIIDRVNTTGTVFLGLTVGCCQCHDHKFDPIAQREYYQFFAFFNSQDEPALELLTPEQQRQRQRHRAEVAALTKRLRPIDPVTPAAVEAWERRLTEESRALLPRAVRIIVMVAPNGRSAKQIATLTNYVRRVDKLRHAVGGLANPLPFLALAHADMLAERNRLEKRLAALKKKEPAVVTTMILRERQKPRDTHVLLGGDFTRPGVLVQPGVPAVLPPLKAMQRPNRLDLAKWIVGPENPLTARVTVNRIWQHHFGLGIVETENDFGTQGSRPTHPELLDWLASEFVRRGWSMKELHRLIVTSATYRQSSKGRPDLATVDPRDRLLARMPRLRLEAEAVRDVALAASGLLSQKVGGPSVFPPQPTGVYQTTQIKREWRTSTGPDRYRRGLYTYFFRSAPHPALTVFDAPDATSTCTRRNRSNTPLQALTLLNDAGFVEFAEALAHRGLREVPDGDDAARLRHLFRLCLSREPRPAELERLQIFLRQMRTAGGPEEAARASVGRVLLNLDELITRE